MADGAKHPEVATPTVDLFVKAAAEYRDIIADIAAKRARLVDLNATMRRAKAAAELARGRLIDLGFGDCVCGCERFVSHTNRERETAELFCARCDLYCGYTSAREMAQLAQGISRASGTDETEGPKQ